MSNFEPKGPHGSHTYIDRGGYLHQVANKFGRSPEGLCLKISYSFFLQPGETIDDYVCAWGGSHNPIQGCAQIQNICYWHGLAPRVYAIDEIKWEGQRALCQLQDYVGDGEPQNDELYEKVYATIRKFGGDAFDYGGTWNSAGGKWVGFKAAHWVDKDIYKDMIEKALGKRIPDKLQGVKNKVEHAEIFVPKIKLDAHRHLANYLEYFNVDYVAE